MTEKPKKLIIYSELNDLSWVETMIRKHGLDVFVVENGVEAFERTKVEVPDFVFLDVTMDKMNGIECTQNIKQLSASVRVMLVSAINSLSIQDAAKKARADLFVVGSVASVKVPEFVESAIQQKQLPPDMSEDIEREVLSRRGAARFPMESEVQFKIRDHWVSGIFVNVSQDGLLFQCEQAISVGEKLLISWIDRGKKHIEIPAVTVRQISSGHPKYPYVIGVQFMKTSSNLNQTLTELSSEIEGLQQDAEIELDLHLIQDLLIQGTDYFQKLFRGTKAPLFMELSISDIVEHERNSFQHQDEYSLCIQQLVSAKIISQLIGSATDQMKNAGSSSRPYIGQIVTMSKDLLAKIEKVEEVSDLLVKKCMQENLTTERHQLNESSNRLYQAKASMLSDLSQKIRRSNVPDAQIPDFDFILQKNRQLTSYNEHLEEIMKKEAKQNSARISKIPQRSNEKPSKKRQVILEVKQPKPLAALPIIALLLILGNLIPLVGERMEVYFSQQDFPLIIKPRRIERKTHGGLLIDLAKNVWNSLGPKDQDQLMDQAEVYLTRKHLHQCKIMDGDVLLAAVYGNVNEDEPGYFRKVFAEGPVVPVRPAIEEKSMDAVTPKAEPTPLVIPKNLKSKPNPSPKPGRSR